MTGSSTWVEFDGTSVTRKVWDGRAWIEQSETDSAVGGHIEGLTRRLYNPESRQAEPSLNSPIVGCPMVPFDGEAIHLYMNYWPGNANFITDHNPSLELRGHWQNPNLVMNDDSSIARAFQPDGTVYDGQLIGLT